MNDTWDAQRVIHLLTGTPEDARMIEILDRVTTNLKAIEAEREAGMKDLIQLNNKECMVQSIRIEENKVLLLITPYEDLSGRDWDAILPQGHMLQIQNEHTFLASAAETHKTTKRFMSQRDPSWIALVLHSERAAICAVLQNDHNVSEALFNIDEDATVWPDTSDPTAQCAETAMLGSEIACKEDLLTDIMSQLQTTDGRRYSAAGSLANIFLNNRPITHKQFFRNQAYQVDFEGNLSLATESQREAIQGVHDYAFYLIHGAPGTAKTFTLVLIVESILSPATDRIEERETP
ncbi:hypothetical protein H2200_009996 [Cladophialophora chaetospira]|uniref:Uncharacterized protein n=1 Tax=Cladophialophora chaetospira TaxID=386627 RepID=A0AA38X201_9EURO|nr:hypothetical protein H2200_009996 [Cladophialophora chaetospira]